MRSLPCHGHYEDMLHPRIPTSADSACPTPSPGEVPVPPLSGLKKRRKWPEQSTQARRHPPSPTALIRAPIFILPLPTLTTDVSRQMTCPWGSPSSLKKPARSQQLPDGRLWGDERKGLRPRLMSREGRCAGHSRDPHLRPASRGPVGSLPVSSSSNDPQASPDPDRVQLVLRRHQRKSIVSQAPMHH